MPESEIKPHLFPFSDAMSFGFAVLRLPPDRFWMMTPRELRAASKPYRKKSSDQHITRESFDALMSSFPDLHLKV